jgi:hypothetical protein
MGLLTIFSRIIGVDINPSKKELGNYYKNINLG